MIPNTRHGLSPYECVSAMQKHVRRGEELDAMRCFMEMSMTSKNFFSWACNRLVVISHEDIGIANPVAVMYATIHIEQARGLYKGPGEDTGAYPMVIGGVIRLLCRGPKSRENDHFQAVVAGEQGNDVAPEIPDYAYCHHTHQGKKRGRGLDFFRQVASKLVPPPAEKDPYEDDAYRYWAQLQP
ncbi:hypothetical protein [Botrimarina sp.]|uniref:hypothetical protein n=1 Tax=Botrimarina sp. TaxID=2795802 RepID=UPI0032EB3A9A